MGKRKLFTILLLIISLFIFSGCKDTEAPSNNIEESNSASQEQQPNETQDQLGEQSQQEASGEGEDSESLLETSETTSGEAEQEDSKQQGSDQDNRTDSQNTGESANVENNEKTSITIEGTGIGKSLILSLDDLKGMKDYYFEDDFFSLNSYGTKEYFHFKGIKIKALLEKAELKENAEIIKFIASDGYEQEFTIGQALKEDYIDEENPDKKYPVIIAWHENGEDYDIEKGAPFRLVIGQKEPGDVNKPQWVQNVAKIVID